MFSSGIRNYKLARYFGIAISFLIILFTLTTCSEGDPDPDNLPDEFEDPLEGLPDEGPVNFEDPVIGQRSRYVLFEATQSNEGDVTFNYLPDTLVYAIVGRPGIEWLMAEFLTEGSNSRLNPDDSYWGPIGDSVLFSNLDLANDSIYLYKPSGTLAFSYISLGDRKFRLSMVSDDFPENEEGLPEFDYANVKWMEFTVDFTNFGQTFERLNVYSDYTDMGGDGYGFTYFYGPEDGIVRYTWVYYWDLYKAGGWDLLPN